MTRYLYLILGENMTALGEDGKMRPNYATRFLVFNTNGDYIKTLELGYQIMGTCFDKEITDLVMGLNDAMQFAYLDLDGIV